MYTCNGYSNTGNMNISVDNLNQIKIRRYATVFISEVHVTGIIKKTKTNHTGSKNARP